MKRLADVRPFVAASLTEVGVRCGRSGCRCATGDPHPASYLSLKREGKTLTVYVPKDRVGEVRQWVEEHRRVKILLHEISELTVGLLKAEARLRKQSRAPRVR